MLLPKTVGRLDFTGQKKMVCGVEQRSDSCLIDVFICEAIHSTIRRLKTRLHRGWCKQKAEQNKSNWGTECQKSNNKHLAGFAVGEERNWDIMVRKSHFLPGRVRDWRHLAGIAQCLTLKCHQKSLSPRPEMNGCPFICVCEVWSEPCEEAGIAISY